jgi:UDP-hydrolysing UDP-N-acetyl-D-glucosamine 2-epimerase
MKKIIAFSAIRSEYDLLSSLYKLLTKDENIELKIIVSGAHLCKDYGYSVKEIEADGLDILARFDTLGDTRQKTSRIKSAAILMQKAIDTVNEYNPDLIIFAGDREEVIIAALIGGYLEIPTMHFFGGDHVKDSHIDNPVRHATSKLSTIHMVSTKKHRDRLVKMGEDSKRIFNIGSVALDKFVSIQAFSKKLILENFNIKKGFEKFCIVIFHPIPKERNKSATIFENILKSLKYNNIYAFVSYPNIDPGNKEIVDVISRYNNDSNFVFYKNLARDLFISIYKHGQFIIGNSSSGVLESASIPIGAINVGIRQSARDSNDNLIFCDTDTSSIQSAIEKIQSKEFQEIIKNTKNIYGDGKSSKRAFNIIKSNDFKNLVFKDEDILEQ